MAKVNESKKKGLEIQVVTCKGPCSVIPLTPKFIAAICHAKNESGGYPEGWMEKLTESLYDAIFNEDGEEDNEKPEKDGQA